MDFFPLLTTTKGSQRLPLVVWENLRASATVALVSVSLSIALGIASGSTPMAGLATAVWGGLASGALGSSQYNIVGPAGALTGMLSGYALKWSPQILPWLALCSAPCIWLIQVTKVQSYMLVMPNSVFEGFTLAVAILIGLGQLNNAFGLAPEHVHPHFVLNLYESLAELGHALPASMAIFFPLTVALHVLLIKWPKIPWMTVLPVATIILGYLSRDTLPTDRWFLPTIGSKFGEIKGSDFLALPSVSAVSALSGDDVPAFLAAVAAVSFVAVLETLICAKIASFRAGFSFSEWGEMRGLGAAHLVCGLFGGMPPTGVFVRTSINLDLGATHKTSQFVNAIFVLVVTLAVMPLLQYLPLAAIAAVLMVAAGRMLPKRYLASLWKTDRASLALCLITALVCVVEDPVIGLLVGMLLALLRNGRNAAKSLTMVEHVHSKDGKETRVVIRGPVTFINSEAVLEMALAKVPEASSQVIIDLQHMTALDLDGRDAISKLAKQLEGQATNVMVRQERGNEQRPWAVSAVALAHINQRTHKLETTGDLAEDDFRHRDAGLDAGDVLPHFTPKDGVITYGSP